MKIALKYEWLLHKKYYLLFIPILVIASLFLLSELYFLHEHSFNPEITESYTGENQEYYYEFRGYLTAIFFPLVLYVLLLFILSIYHDYKFITRLRVLKINILKLVTVKTLIFTALFSLVALSNILFHYYGYRLYYLPFDDVISKIKQEELQSETQGRMLYWSVIYLFIVVNGWMWFKYNLQQQHPIYIFMKLFITNVLLFMALFSGPGIQYIMIIIASIYLLYLFTSFVIYIRKLNQGG